MKTKILFFLLFSFFCGNAQICNRTKPYNNQDYELFQEKFIPNDSTPILTIKIAFHIWSDDNGNGNFWLNTPESRNNLDTVIMKLNWIYSINSQNSDPIDSASYIKDTKVRFEIDTVYYYNNSTVVNSSSYYTLLNYFNNTFSNRKIVFPCHLIPQKNASGGAGISFFGGDEQIIEFNQKPDSVNLWCLAQNIAHEFGHNFRLKHTYDNGEPEITNINGIDFLWDVFGLTTQFWCTKPQGYVCLHDAGWTIDFLIARFN